MNLESHDIKRLNELGISQETVQAQVKMLLNGPKKLDLRNACVIDNGIEQISEENKKRLIDAYASLIENKSVSIFTPASGAATRMFKHLINPESDAVLYKEFVNHLEKFAFFSQIPEATKKSNESNVDYILGMDGLNYQNLPKAMIGFHQYGKQEVKAIQEQLIEGLSYININGLSKFHFTVSPEHKEIISEYLSQIIPEIEERVGTKIECSFSYQERKTDTIALDENDQLVRDEDHTLFFRPGGHGALIHNLGSIESEVVFIKNIDNIARREYHPVVIEHKKIIGAYLLERQAEVFEILRSLDGDNSNTSLEKHQEWIRKHLSLEVEKEESAIRKALDRPMRVCGMVKNEGKAGGGPFWVGNSVQIVEGAQMDENDPEIARMLKNASHFNPVDIVCGIKNYKGEAFNLLEYKDDTTFFVSEKSYLGKEIKVLEHPGLWNGAMANWLTFFIEVPVETFHPVKTVNDLLLPAHCSI